MKNDLPVEVQIEDKASSMAMMLSPERMQSAMTLAKIMASSVVTVPKHLQGKEGDCMAIILQSMNWGMNPYAVAQKTHLVNGTLGYEAQLVNAVVQSQGFIEGTFQYEFQEVGSEVKCRVGAISRGQKTITWGEWLSSADVTTKNSPLWKTNKKQQMAYLQVKNWTRLYHPAAIMGVYTDDELETLPAYVPEKDVTAESETVVEVVYLDDATFNALADKYSDAVASGKKTVNDFIAWVEGKGSRLTEEQKIEVAGWPKQNTGGQVDDDFVSALNEVEQQGA